MAGMGRARFACDEVFDDDYLYFHAPHVDGEVAADEADLIEELLGLSPGQRVLDVGCGHGRIALELAQRGYRVTGIDRSVEFLNHARKSAEQGRVEGVEFVQLDMCELYAQCAFEGAVCWFSTLGYHDDDTEQDVLRRLHSALVPGGILVVEHVPRDEWVAEFGAGQLLVRDGDFLIDRSRYDPSDRRLHARRTIVRAGQQRSMDFSVRLFTPDELAQWLLDAGFAWAQVLDGDGQRFEQGADRLVIVAGRDDDASAASAARR